MRTPAEASTTSLGAGGPGRGPATSGRPAGLVLLLPAYAITITAAAAGLGLAVPRLREQGMVTGALVGLGLAAGGLVLSGWVAWRALHAARRRWWVLLLPLLLVTTYVAMWSVGQAVVASFPAHPKLGERTPAAVGLPYREVTLRTRDEVELAAWWVPTRNGAAVVLLHGAGSTRTAVLDHAAVLAQGGYGVLLLDARGHGESDGRGMDFGWYGEADTAAAVGYVVDAPGVAADRIGVVGLSMGGETAIGAAAEDPRVRAVVAEGATNRVAADKEFLDVYGFRGQLQQQIDQLTYAVAGLLTGAPEPAPLRDSIRVTGQRVPPTPTLLIAAATVETEQLAARLMESAAPESVRTWTVADAGHIQGLRTDPRAWQETVLGFLDQALPGGTR